MNRPQYQRPISQSSAAMNTNELVIRRHSMKALTKVLRPTDFTSSDLHYDLLKIDQKTVISKAKHVKPSTSKERHHYYLDGLFLKKGS